MALHAPGPDQPLSAVHGLTKRQGARIGCVDVTFEVQLPPLRVVLVTAPDAVLAARLALRLRSPAGWTG